MFEVIQHIGAIAACIVLGGAWPCQTHKEIDMTTEWILIMTLWSTHDPFMETLPGFATHEQCEAAGTTWRNQFNSRTATSTYEPARTACVYRGAAGTEPEKVER
jgi:hypothetical protein